MYFINTCIIHVTSVQVIHSRFSHQSDENLFDYNVDERVDSFIKACKDQVSCLAMLQYSIHSW